MVNNKKSSEVSPKFSLKGYSLVTWFKENKLWFIKNKETIKSLVSGLLGIVVARFGGNPFIALLFGIGGAYGSKLIIDGLDFWLTDVELERKNA